MKTQLTNTLGTNYTQIAPAGYTIAGGAAGWIDTDVSGTTGTDTSRNWLVMWFTNAMAFQNTGVRQNGSALDSKVVAAFGTQFVHVSAAGHVDLYREAANTVYTFMGSFG